MLPLPRPQGSQTGHHESDPPPGNRPDGSHQRHPDDGGAGLGSTGPADSPPRSRARERGPGDGERRTEHARVSHGARRAGEQEQRESRGQPKDKEAQADATSPITMSSR